MKTEYQQALDYLYSFTDYAKQSGYQYSPERFDLQRVRHLLALMGEHAGCNAPHKRFQSVHVAGTKGKGSTSAMIASILRESGCRTGLYTSPHLHTFRERMQVDGQLVSESQVVAGVDLIRAVAPLVPEITTFELITALAFHHFAQAQCDIAVIEVGMGGRLDATNVIEPMVSVITPISYDHTMYLGDTLAEIAAEKAGIIKPGVPIVSAPQAQEAYAVIERFAIQQECSLTLVGRDWKWETLSSSAQGQQIQVWGPAASSHSQPPPVYNLSLLGRHQQENAVTALATVAQLKSLGRDIPDSALSAGLHNTQWPGRLEVLNRSPWMILDGAHNGHSMRKLRAAINELFPHQNVILILGVSADKDLDGIFDAILPVARHVLLTQAHHPRAATAESLAEYVTDRVNQGNGHSADLMQQIVPIDQALDTAQALADKNDLICITGSLFVVAELRETWLKRTGQPVPSD